MPFWKFLRRNAKTIQPTHPSSRSTLRRVCEDKNKGSINVRNQKKTTHYWLKTIPKLIGASVAGYIKRCMGDLWFNRGYSCKSCCNSVHSLDNCKVIDNLLKNHCFQDAWENARSFVGGLELIVNLLKSDDIEVNLWSFLVFCFTSKRSLRLYSLMSAYLDLYHTYPQYIVTGPISNKSIGVFFFVISTCCSFFQQHNNMLPKTNSHCQRNRFLRFLTEASLPFPFDSSTRPVLKKPVGELVQIFH